MNDDEKKDLSDPRINYRNDWAEKHGGKNKAANEKSNQAEGKKVERIKDAKSGKVNTIEEHLLKGKEKEGGSFVDRLEKKEPIRSRKAIVDLHLKSTTSLTDPETSKQNLKDASKSGFRKGGSSGRGGASLMPEPHDILKNKNDVVNPEDILSKKSKGSSFLLAMNEEKKPIITNREQPKKTQQNFKEEPKAQQKAAQEKFEQKQKVQAKSFKPAAPKDIFDTLPKKSEGKVFKPSPTRDIFDAKSIKNITPQTTVKKVEKSPPSPSQTVKLKPAGTGKIKR